ncbi:carbohydrate ABC transporter permease [Halorubrum kocurii]|uniref:Binding-protein-dependent transport systems inner membrane component n=1 Tax=Halorubrum kocurii JCM 14978 TaxID=1230456 RepID=M0P5V2_9EURY|nr:sugar ABC transporter permease [Halorubrum kocurii]EMA64914.1 binding-protein-dependent transport systems inner membrane component [Halorubrum kocurii JCM 14978]
MATSDETDDRIGQAYRRRVRTTVRTAARKFRRAARPLWDRFRFARQDLTAATPTLPRVAYIFIAPFFLLFSVFLAFPVFYTLYLSFFEYQGVGQGSLFWVDLGPVYLEIPKIARLDFVGLGNYARLLGNDLFWQSMFNTSYILVIQVPLMIGLALALALALNASFLRLKGVFRTAIALPVSANLVAYSTVFLLLFNEQLGFLNYVLAGVGLGPVPWLTDGFWARNTIIAAVTWRWTGYNMIILLAGLQTIPQQLYEAAEIDGANRWEKFRYVTLPQLKPVFLFVVVLSTIGTFKLFAEPYVITGGGPTNSTITIVQYIYRQAFVNFNLGYASALTVVFVAVVSAFSVAQIKIGGED